jgi:hypothetical protein
VADTINDEMDIEALFRKNEDVSPTDSEGRSDDLRMEALCGIWVNPLSDAIYRNSVEEIGRASCRERVYIAV